ncbi:T9SS type A sorting domain-containing protein [Moheibacter lacus]|uniref:T9SS type A sorting domain-containing protein n=1 Tax=Moheibacter lacus TaxID=2745851 RepID=A0A838ZU20_9FLAO|nr:T9SS type A sorting domain-containing protein [Moheibacter lacus]MBA5630490.1 T9SS type A sorting domain-containing protein [Moheibacter lacus]
MKKHLLTAFFLNLFLIAFSQNIVFEDINFKNKLLQSSPTNQIAKDLNGNYFAIDANGNGEISQNEAIQVSYLDVSDSGINSMTGILFFDNLQYLDCSENVLSKLYLYEYSTGDNLYQLKELNTSGNFPLHDLDIRQLHNLEDINVSGNALSNTIINYYKFEGLFTRGKKVNVSNNAFTQIDLNSVELEEFIFDQNPLHTLNIQDNKIQNLYIPTFEDLTSITLNLYEETELEIAVQPIIETLFIESNQNFNGTIELKDQIITDALIIRAFNSNVILDNTGIADFQNIELFANSLVVKNSSVINILNLRNTLLYSLSLENLPNLVNLTLARPAENLDLDAFPSLENLHMEQHVGYAIPEEFEDDYIPMSFDFSEDLFPNLKSLEVFAFDLISDLYIHDLNSLEYINVNIGYFDCENVVIQNLPSLEVLLISGVNRLNMNDENQLIIQNFPQLNSLDILLKNPNGNDVDDFIFFNLPSLSNVIIDFYEVTSHSVKTIDFSGAPSLISLKLFELRSAGIDFLNLKNGNEQMEYINILHTGISHICVDSEFERDYIDQNYDVPTVEFTYDCPFHSGGYFNKTEGLLKIDVNQNNCINSNVFANGYRIDNFANSINLKSFTNSFGYYNFFNQYLNEEITIQPQSNDYFQISPPTQTVNYSEYGNISNFDFCLKPIGIHNDLDIVIIPIDDPRPGFDVSYKILYKNKGNTTLSGDVKLQFQDDFMEFISSNPNFDNQSFGQLTWNYTDLHPFESREILVKFNFNTPTDPNFPLNNGDWISFNTTISPFDDDETENDNFYSLRQEVINSFDPNDKICLEGEIIAPEQVGEYVYYKIRFENTGTADAVNIVVKDIIDLNKLDMNSFTPVTASHSFETRIKNENIVEFIFENINLPFDDTNNDGYVVFKIKTLDTLELNDVFTNQAEIYFDYNSPIITNNYETTVSDEMNLSDVEINEFIIYPNPIKDSFQISSKEKIQKVEIFDSLGRIIKRFTSKESYSIRELSTGIYFVRIYFNYSFVTKKIIK